MIHTTYTGRQTDCISFPLGGIGTGSIGLAGNGRLLDWDIYNRPDKGSLNGYTHFAVKAETPDGKLVDARILNGDCNTNLSGWDGFGVPGGTMAGFPHFRDCVFEGRYPTAELSFADEHFPGQAKMTAFNPMIPLNDRDSSIPAAFFEISIQNTSEQTLEYTAAFTVRNPSNPSVNTYFEGYRLRGIRLGQKDIAADSKDRRELSIATCDLGGSQQEYWYRGGWFDSLETYWRNFTELTDFPNRHYDYDGGNDHATLAVRKSAEPGETLTFRFVLSWFVPNNYNYWNPLKKKLDDGTEVDVTWKNYYAKLFEDSADAATYSLANWDMLYRDTVKFRDELFASTLPAEVIEAASATMSVLKTATVFRLENGEFYGWEGQYRNVGSCEGTCTHVWNYAYALCFLFPALERSIRDTDYAFNRDENGRMQFRMQLPLGRPHGDWRACVDGQMGGVIKSYREWKICGNDEWLKKNWEGIKASLEYAWNPNNFDGWDRDHDGVLEGRQHHTLDMELFGPSSWLEGFYLCALKCGSEMARYLGDDKAADEYDALFASGKKWTDENLFNGKWYCQKIDLKDRARLENYTVCGNGTDYWNDEAGEIKYQIGEGSEIDQLLGQWHANILGLGDIFDPEQRKTALRSLYRNNYVTSMREHYNPWRLFGVNDDAGTIICTYPDGTKKPAIPIPYCQETMHGFEYALAGLMISEGMIDEGLEIVRAVRNRYDGEHRNPWNEIECGFNYARSMASFAMIPLFSGFRFDMTKKRIGFAPLVNRDAFRCFWSLDAAWGRVEISGGCMTLRILSGTLPLREIVTELNASSVSIDGHEAAFRQEDGVIILDEDAAVTDSVVIR